MASREEEIKRSMLIAAKKVKRDVAANTYQLSAGICNGIVHHPAFSSYAWKEIKVYLVAIFEQWPEYSGDKDYPIRAIISGSCSEKYMHTKNKWNKWTFYGRARHRLLDFIIDTLVKEQGDA